MSQAAPYAISTSSPLIPQAAEQPVSFASKYDVVREIYCYISTVPSETYPWDPAILRSIWAIEPEVVPVWIRRVYRTPAGSDLVFGYHGLYRYKPIPDTQRPVVPELRHIGVSSVGRRFERPNIEWLILEGDPPKNLIGWPGIFLPFDWKTYQDLRKSWYFSQFAVEDNAKLAKIILEQAAEKKARAEARLKAEQDYRWDHEWAYMKKQGEKLSDEEIESIGYQELPTKRPFAGLEPGQVGPGSGETLLKGVL